MKSTFLTAVVSCLLSTMLSARTMVTVSDQTGFDGLDARIHSLILAGEREIDVRIQPGTYFFREEHLNLMGLQVPDLSISISGSDARLVGAGKDYVSSWSWRGMSAEFDGTFQIENGYVELETGRNWDFRSEVRQARKRPEIVDKKTVCVVS